MLLALKTLAGIIIQAKVFQRRYQPWAGLGKSDVHFAALIDIQNMSTCLWCGCILAMQDPKEGQDGAVVPVATPSRALAMFWSKYKVPKGCTMDASDTNKVETGTPNPTEPTGVEGGGNRTEPTGVEGEPTNTESTGVEGEPTNAEPTGVEGEPTNTEHVEPLSSSKMTKLESSSSVDSMTLESGWRYDEKMKKRKLRQRLVLWVPFQALLWKYQQLELRDSRMPRVCPHPPKLLEISNLMLG